MTFGYDDFGAVAQRLHFRIDPPEKHLLAAEHSIDGVLDGVHVYVRQWQGQWVHVEFTAWLTPALDLRLLIERESVGAKLGHLVGRHDIEIGDPELDRAWKIKADEPERAKALFTPAVRAAMLGWKKSGVPLRITDETVSFWVTPGAYSTLSQPVLEQDIRAAVGLVTALAAATPNVPSSTLFAEYVEAWRAYATARGLELTASPLRVSGRLDGSPFTARAVATDERRWGVDVHLAFDEPLPFALRVRPKRFFDFMVLSGEPPHLELGDPAFDGELRTSTTEPPKAKAFLDEGVRRALLELHATAGDVQLDERGLAVRTKTMTDPETFGRIAERVALVARKLHERAGPYR